MAEFQDSAKRAVLNRMDDDTLEIQFTSLQQAHPIPRPANQFRQALLRCPRRRASQSSRQRNRPAPPKAHGIQQESARKTTKTGGIEKAIPTHPNIRAFPQPRRNPRQPKRKANAAHEIQFRQEQIATKGYEIDIGAQRLDIQQLIKNK